MLEYFTPRWVEVNIDAVLHNLQEIRRLVGPTVKIMAVVKADAYGHGAVGVSRALEEAGVDFLAVTALEEGIELRRQGIAAPILIFAPLLGSQAGIAIDYQLTPSVNSEETARLISRAARSRRRRVEVHLKVETGMGRTGVSPSAAVELAAAIAEDPWLELEGLYTHMAAAASGKRSDRRYCEEQFKKFCWVVDTLAQRGIHIPLRHVCNSAALLAFPHMHLDMVRPGTLLYGQYPVGRLPRLLKLENPWQLKARILQVQDFPPGVSIGYDRTVITRRRTRVAVLPVGYVDGFTLEPRLRPRSLWELLRVWVRALLAWLWGSRWREVVEINGKVAPVLGKVAMQLCMVDVTDIPEAQVGTIASFPARRTAVNRSLPRLYLRENRPWLVSSFLGEETMLAKGREVSVSENT